MKTFIEKIKFDMENQDKKGNIEHPVVVGSWVSVDNRLPEIPKDSPSYMQEVKVIACWGKEMNNVAQMSYCKRSVRGKDVYRFEWNGRISPWKIDYWMEFPKPPNYL